MLIPDAKRYLVPGALRAQRRDGGAEDFGHLRLGNLVSGDAIVNLFCC